MQKIKQNKVKVTFGGGGWYFIKVVGEGFSGRVASDQRFEGKEARRHAYNYKKNISDRGNIKNKGSFGMANIEGVCSLNNFRM